MIIKVLLQKEYFACCSDRTRHSYKYYILNCHIGNKELFVLYKYWKETTKCLQKFAVVCLPSSPSTSSHDLTSTSALAMKISPQPWGSSHRTCAGTYRGLVFCSYHPEYQPSVYGARDADHGCLIGDSPKLHAKSSMDAIFYLI